MPVSCMAMMTVLHASNMNLKTTSTHVERFICCHLSFSYIRAVEQNGQPGRVTSASQGSVNTSFDLFKSNKDTADWWNQTLCGQQAWQMLKGRTKGGRFYGYKINHPFGQVVTHPFNQMSFYYRSNMFTPLQLAFMKGFLYALGRQKKTSTR